MPAGLLELLQRRVALEALGESGCSLGAEVIVAQTASMGAETGAEACQGAPLERHVLGFCALQGGGLYIYGTATLTNTNV